MLYVYTPSQKWDSVTIFEYFAMGSKSEKVNCMRELK